MITYHMNWPAGNDPFYLANIEENVARRYYYNVNYVPHVFIDGFIDGLSGGPWEDMMLERYAEDSWLTIELSGQMLSATTGEVTAHITNTGVSSVNGTLHFVLIEDDIAYGGEIWNHVMRDYFPDVSGEAIVLGAGDDLIRTEAFTIPDPPDSWVTENLEAIVFVQNDGTKEIYQAGRIFFHMDEPELVLNGSIVNDSVGGDGNGRLDPGESADIIYGLANLNPVTATNVSATMSSSDPYLDIVDGSATWPDIVYWATEQNDADPFVLAVDADTPWGREIAVTLSILADSRSYSKSIALTIPVGSPNHPIGPDEYGYYAYEDSDDYAPAPTYDWVEIDPNLGGAGTLFTLGDDQTRRIDAPFTFQYYGETFDRISICSNGWVALGDTYVQSPSNGEIPGPVGPPNMIAAFWCDLNPIAAGGGKVYVYYDVDNGRYIVEFSGVEHYHGQGLGVPETFEFILYDPAVHETPTGDGEIVMQYNLISDASGCVVGIEDGTETIGIQYLASGKLNAAASGLAEGRAIKFSTVDPSGGAAVEDEMASVRAGMLLARPNPACGAMQISYNVPVAGEVALRIFGPDGARVRTLLQGHVAAGAGTVEWDGRSDRGQDVPAGVYFYRLSGAEFTVNRKIVKY